MNNSNDYNGYDNEDLNNKEPKIKPNSLIHIRNL